MSNYDKCEKEFFEKGERFFDYYENECDNCGQPCIKIFCCKACYLICKADHEADHEMDKHK